MSEANNELKCQDKELNGECTKGKDCPICNKQIKDEKKEGKKEGADELNVNAQVFVPSKNKPVPENLKFNLKADPYIPKGQDEDSDEENQEEIDMIMKDVVEDELMDELGDDSEDEEKWFPKYKDCECCKGYVYRCKGVACESLGQCYCKMKDDCDDLP